MNLQLKVLNITYIKQIKNPGPPYISKPWLQTHCESLWAAFSESPNAQIRYKNSPEWTERED